MQSITYKIEKKDTWLQARQVGTYFGSTLDMKDGFIHLSTLEQLGDTLRLHFNGAKGLVIAAVKLLDEDENLRWEASRGGAKFPHLYAPLKMENVIECFDAEYDGEIPIIPQSLIKFFEKGYNQEGVDENEI
jgi:uncharacterized protein (DUF952 family)